MKTMKTKWAKAGTMFLAAAAVLSSCSNEEVIPGGETPVGERDAVKTSFSFAIPSPVSRATSDDVQGKFEVNAFFKFERRLCRSQFGIGRCYPVDRF